MCTREEAEVLGLKKEMDIKAEEAYWATLLVLASHNTEAVKLRDYCRERFSGSSVPIRVEEVGGSRARLRIGGMMAEKIG